MHPLESRIYNVRKLTIKHESFDAPFKIRIKVRKLFGKKKISLIQRVHALLKVRARKLS